MAPLTTRPDASRLLLLSAIALGTACGDTVRSSHYVGEPPFLIHYRFAEPLATLAGEGEEVVLWLQDTHGSGIALRYGDRYGNAQEGVLEVPPNLRRDTFSFPPEDALQGGPVVFLLQATGERRPELGGTSGLPRRAAALDHWLVHRSRYRTQVTNNEEVPPVGIRRWPFDVTRGYSLVRRSCSAETIVRFESVDPETVVELRPLEASASNLSYRFDPEAYDATFFKACGLLPPPPLPGTRISDDLAAELAFAPDTDTLFVLHVPPENRALSFAPTVSSWSPGETLAPIASGVFRGRLQVAAGNAVTIGAFESRDPVLVQLRPGPAAGPWTTRRLPVDPDALLSPLGDRLVFAAGARGAEQIAVHDLATGTTRELSPGLPLAWSSDGTRLLGMDRYPSQNVFLQPADGGGRVYLPRPLRVPPRVTSTETTRYLFGPDGPLMLQRQGEPARSQGEPLDLRQGGLLPTLAAIDLTASSERLLLLDERGPIASHLAPAHDGRSLLAWSVTCPGLGEDYCAAELHRITVADGSHEIVLRARRPGPIALARDGRTLAVSNGEGVFVTTLP